MKRKKRSSISLKLLVILALAFLMLNLHVTRAQGYCGAGTYYSGGSCYNCPQGKSKIPLV